MIGNEIVEVFSDYLESHHFERWYYVKGFEKYGELLKDYKAFVIIANQFGYLDTGTGKEYYAFIRYDDLREACKVLYSMLELSGIKLFSKTELELRIKQAKLNGILERMEKDFV